MINGLIRRPWPPEVKEALEKFRQGDLIEKPPFFYGHGGDVRLWDLGDADLEDEADSAVEELHPDDSPPLGIITSQTCDVDEQGEPMQPWFQVSPVYKLIGSEDEQAWLASKQFTYELSGPGLPEGRWIADLRVEVPLEKSALIGRAPIRGFASEQEAEEFGKRLGVRRARPALANRLVDAIIALLRGRRGKRKGMWKNQIFRLMLEIEGGRLTPVAARLHVITNVEPSEDVRDFFDEWEDETREGAQQVGIDLWETRYHDARAISLPDYDRWLDLNLP